MLVAGNVNLRSNGGVKFDLDRCICGLLALCAPAKLPVEVADFNLLTSGFSIGHGLGIFESHGMSGDGGAITGDKDGPVMMPSATFRMSLSHLSQRLRFTGGLSVSGVDNGLPSGRILLSGSIMADVEAVMEGVPGALRAWTENPEGSRILF